MGNDKVLSEDVIAKIDEIYNDVVILCLHLKTFNKDMLCKAYKLDSDTCDELIRTLVVNKVVDYKDDFGELEINKNYNHSDYLLERELAEDSKNKAIESKKNKEMKVKSNMNVIFGSIAIITFCISVYFGFREPMSLLLIVPLCLFAGSLFEKIGAIPSSLIVVIICVFSLIWINSIDPIWGDRYDDKLRYEEIKERARAEEREESLKIINAENAVSRSMKDPSSAKFMNSRLQYSGTVCGLVNGKNSFGAYAGYQRYVYYSGIAAIDDGSPSFSSIWDNKCN